MTRAFSNELNTLNQKLIDFDKNICPLKGLTTAKRRDAFVRQLVSSVRRVEFVKQLDQRKISPERANPTSDLFDPLRAAILHRNKGNLDEAVWLVFLATHFGKHADDGWRLMTDIYWAFGKRPAWTWLTIVKDKGAFEAWANGDLPKLLSDGVSRRFSNHRKYESKKPKAIIDALLAYVQMVEAYGDHRHWLIAAHKAVGQNPTEAFHYLYSSLDQAKRFGRLGRFDFLTMVGKLGLMPIEPGIAYLHGATGPLRGARLLFKGNADSSANAASLELLLAKLNGSLNVGMQVLEDSMCNWQKSPDKYVYFRG